MLLRFGLSALFVFITSVQSWACSCAPWSGHVSEFTQNYISVWAVPTKAVVNIESLDKPRGGVTYTLEILDGFGVVELNRINVDSNVADGGTCGVDLAMGRPQFISTYSYDTDKYSISSCTPHLPYEAVKLYLKTGKDSFIPELSKCHHWPKESSNHSPILNEELEECAVWKGAAHRNFPQGYKDYSKYREIWWDKINSVKPKKKHPWWSFKKD